MSQSPKNNPAKPRCGLCGKTKTLVQTECCGQWICDDEAIMSCSPTRRTVVRGITDVTRCAPFIIGEGHPGHWRDCKIAANRSRPKFMSGMARTNSISRNWKIRRRLSRRCATVAAQRQPRHGRLFRRTKGTLCNRCCQKEFFAPAAKPKRAAAPRLRKTVDILNRCTSSNASVGWRTGGP